MFLIYYLHRAKKGKNIEERYVLMEDKMKRFNVCLIRVQMRK